jgi:hypothetical protein
MEHVRKIDRELISISLKKVLDSETFSRSERLRAFLKYVVEKEQAGLSQQLKGYSIGIDVFFRTESFDPGGNPLVRVQAGKLRKLLEEYYTTEAPGEPMRIRIPLGTYVPTYEWLTGAPAPLPTLRLPDPGPSATPVKRHRLAYAALVMLMPINLGVLGLQATGYFDVSPAEVTGSVSPPPSGIYGTSAVPRIQIHNNITDAQIGTPLSNAIRLAAARLASVDIVDGADAQISHATDNHRLDFTVSISTQASGSGLSLDLTHDQSGTVVFSAAYEQSLATTSAQLADMANSFVASTMPVSGSLYRFSAEADYASALMHCFTDTYRFKLENSSEAYDAARRCQQQFLPTTGAVRLLTSLEALKTMARQSEAAGNIAPKAPSDDKAA